MSIVPTGLTRYRQKLFPLEPYTAAEAGRIIDQVDAFAAGCRAACGSRKFFCADELYLTAGRPLPGEEYYEEFAQLENGVGMITSLVSEFNREMAFLDEDIAEFRAAREAAGLPPHRCISVCTGVAAYPTIRSLAARLEAETEGLEIHVYEIINHFFGETITVAGLLTGKDMAEQLAGQPLGEELLIPENTLRADEAMFLDDMTPDQLSATLGVPVTPARNDGSSLVRQMLGIE